MEILISILIGVASNASYDLVKSWLPSQFSDHNIQKAIREAYNRALKQWTVNSNIRDREKSYLQTRLQEAIQQLLNNPLIESSGSALLELFRVELEKDDRTQGFLHYCISLDTHTLVRQIHDAILPQTAPPLSFANDYFIRHITLVEYHIPRIVRLISLPQKESSEILSERTDSLTDLTIRCPRLVVLGSAGMGKSTELKQLALQLTEICCPFHLPLNTFTGTWTLEQMFASEWLVAGQSKALLLDGLDEVLPEDAERVKREIGRFANVHPEIPIIVSCRSNFYTLPTAGAGGSLNGFAVAALEPLTPAAVQTYIAKAHPSVDPESFLNQVYQRGLIALLENPFWVIAMVEFYQEHKSLGESITELLEYLIERNFKRDASHYDGSIPLVEQRHELFRHLEAIACCMNIAGTRTTTDTEVAELLSDREAYRLIRYSGTFSKDENDHWQFKHGYFQEFLTARLLSRQTFDRILPLIRSASDTVLPGWQNTLTLLLNMLPKGSTLFGLLVGWLAEHDPAGLIAMEPEKLNDDLRISIFKSIFNYYKEKDIWLDDKKVVQTDYARFGGNDNCIRFLIDEACDTANRRRTRLNALNILQSYDFSSCRLNRVIVDRLMQTLAGSDISDDHLIGEIIKSIHAIGPDYQVINTIYEQLKCSQDDHIRHGLYKLLFDNNLHEERIDYFLHGLTISNRIWGLERDILDVIGQCKTPRILRRILAFWTHRIDLLEAHDTFDGFSITAKQLVETCISAFEVDPTFYYYIKHLLHEHCRLYYGNRYNYIRILLTFFDKTGTRERLFTDALKQLKADRYAQSVLEFAITPAFFPLLIQAYQNQMIDSDQLDLICRSTKWDQPEIFESLKQLIETKTDVRIVFPPDIDRGAIYRQQEQDAFDVLFDITGFQKACVDFLGDQDSLSYEEYKARRLNFMKTPHHPSDELVNQSVLLWMSDMTEEPPITLQRIEDWFAQPANMEWFAIQHICDALISKNPPKVSAFQKEYLHRWFDQNIETVDFTQAIYISEGGLGWSRKTQWLVLLLNRFEFQLSDAILLDLTHCCFQDPNWQEKLPITLELLKNT